MSKTTEGTASLVNCLGAPVQHLAFFLSVVLKLQVLPWWLGGQESTCQCGIRRFNPQSVKIPHTVEQLRPCSTTTEPVP